MWLETITILGAPNDDDGNLSDIALDRINCAADIFRKAPHAKFILTGGFGPHFNRTERPHTAYLRVALISFGVPETAVVAELPSSNTREDIEMLSQLLTREAHPEGRHRIVTSDFHVERVKLLVFRIFKSHFPSIIGARDSLEPSRLTLIKQHERAAIEKLNGVPRCK